MEHTPIKVSLFLGTIYSSIKKLEIIKDARMIPEAIFIDLSCFLSFIHQGFRFFSIHRFPKVAAMKKNTKVISI